MIGLTKNRLLKLLAVTLVIALTWQNVSWANPDLLIKPKDTLATQSLFDPINSEELHEIGFLKYIILTTLKAEPAFFGSETDHALNIDGRKVEIGFSERIDVGENAFVVPCYYDDKNKTYWTFVSRSSQDSSRFDVTIYTQNEYAKVSVLGAFDHIPRAEQPRVDGYAAHEEELDEPLREAHQRGEVAIISLGDDDVRSALSFLHGLGARALCQQAYEFIKRGNLFVVTHARCLEKIHASNRSIHIGELVGDRGFAILQAVLEKADVRNGLRWRLEQEFKRYREDPNGYDVSRLAGIKDSIEKFAFVDLIEIEKREYSIARGPQALARLIAESLSAPDSEPIADPEPAVRHSARGDSWASTLIENITSVDKETLDQTLSMLSQDERTQLFRWIDGLAAGSGFESLDVALRYAFVRLLVCDDFEEIGHLLSLSKSLTPTVKANIDRMLVLEQEHYRDTYDTDYTPTFSDIAKHVALPIVEREDYHGFNNSRHMDGMPRVLLVSSYLDGDALRSGLFLAPNLALYRIASFARLFGIQVDVCDADMVGKDQLKEMVEGTEYDFIGFNILHPTIKTTLGTVAEAQRWHRERWAREPVLIGGGQGAAFNYEQLLNKTPLQIIVRGFGEFPVVDMAMDYNRMRPSVMEFSHIPGLYIKNRGAIATTSDIYPYTPDDLRAVSLAIDFARIPYEKYWSLVRERYNGAHLGMMGAKRTVCTIRLYTELLCPMGCTFCSSTNFYKAAFGGRQKVATLPAGDLLLIVKRAIAGHPETDAVYFNDDDFTIRRDRVMAFCDYKKRDRDIKDRDLRFICMTRVDRVDPEMLKRMKEAGFEIVSYGIESASTDALSAMEKKIRPLPHATARAIYDGLVATVRLPGKFRGRTQEEMHSLLVELYAIRETIQAGLKARVNFIIFYPTVDLDDLMLNANVATLMIRGNEDGRYESWPRLEGAPPTHYNFVDAYPGAKIMSQGYDIGVEEFEVPGTGETFQLATRVSMQDPKIQQLAERAIARHEHVKAQIIDEKGWTNGELPSSINTLSFFLAIYEEARRLYPERADELSTGHIEEAIDYLMERNGVASARHSARGHAIEQRIDGGVEALEYCLEFLNEKMQEAKEKTAMTHGKEGLDILKSAIVKLEHIIELSVTLSERIDFTEDIFDTIMFAKERVAELERFQAMAENARNAAGAIKNPSTRERDFGYLIRCLGQLRTTLMSLQSACGASGDIGELTDLLEGLISRIDEMESTKELSLLGGLRMGSMAQKEQMEDFIEDVSAAVNVLLLSSLGRVATEGLPFEPEFGRYDEKVSPRVVYKSLLPALRVAREEIETIESSPDMGIRPIFDINHRVRLKVEARDFRLEEREGWRGWLPCSRGSSRGRRKDKDLVADEIPAILEGLIYDLKRVKDEAGRGAPRAADSTIEDTLEIVRRERSAKIERGMHLFEGREPDLRAYRSLRSRYGKPLLVGLLLAFITLAVIGYFSGGPIRLPILVFDVTIKLALLYKLLYTVYLALYGAFSQSGRYRTTRDDVIEAVPEDRLRAILPAGKANIRSLTDEEFNNLLTHETVSVSLYVYNLPTARLLNALSLCGIDGEGMTRHEMADRVLDIALDLVHRRENLTSQERERLDAIFPLQCIVIPARNDEHIVELVLEKANQVTYPNTVILLALLENDVMTYSRIEEARRMDILPPWVIPHFGHTPGSNAPGEQAKAFTKPKSVNNALAFMAANIEGLIADDGIPIDRMPDFIMNYDLEDHPAPLQLWSMHTANAMIESTVEEVEGLIAQGTAVTLRSLKRENPDLHRRCLRWGIDVDSIGRLRRDYADGVARTRGLNPADDNERTRMLVEAVDVKADTCLLTSIDRAREEADRIEREGHKYDTEPQRLRAECDRQFEQLKHKYSSQDNFVCAEFRRRNMPANYSGILIAKMFGENRLSHLEWVMWFSLLMPGLFSYRYDKTGFLGMLSGFLIGIWQGGFLGGLVGIILGGLVGVVIGRMALALGHDTRNKVALSFSAGTTNNFSGQALLYGLSAYAEYNVAEDWDIALEMARRGYRSFLFDGHKTPTYNDSLPAFVKRWVRQHTRWAGGHYQSFPQLSPRFIKEYGVANYVHSVTCLGLFCLSELFTIYIWSSFLLWLSASVLSKIGEAYGIMVLCTSCWRVMDLMDSILLAMPGGLTTLLVIAIAWPLVITLVTYLAFAKERSDFGDLVDESIDYLRDMVEEYESESNDDVNTLLDDIRYLRGIADELFVTLSSSIEGEADDGGLYARIRDLEEEAEGLRVENRETRSLWQDPKAVESIIKILKSLARGARTGEIEEPWRVLYDIADTMEARLNEQVRREVSKQRARIENLESGIVSIGPIRFSLGKERSAHWKKIVMNPLMIFYYMFNMVAHANFMRQAWKKMESTWLQTGHMVYGRRFYKAMKRELRTASRNIDSFKPAAIGSATGDVAGAGESARRSARGASTESIEAVSRTIQQGNAGRYDDVRRMLRGDSVYEQLEGEWDRTLCEVFPVLSLFDDYNREHTLAVLKYMACMIEGKDEEFNEGKSGQPIPGDLIESYRRKVHALIEDPRGRELLYLSALFHDVGRIVNIQDHPEMSARLIRPIFSFLNDSGYDFRENEIAFLELMAEHHDAANGLSSYEKLSNGISRQMGDKVPGPADREAVSAGLPLLAVCDVRGIREGRFLVPSKMEDILDIFDEERLERHREDAHIKRSISFATQTIAGDTLPDVAHRREEVLAAFRRLPVPTQAIYERQIGHNITTLRYALQVLRGMGHMSPEALVKLFAIMALIAEEYCDNDRETMFTLNFDYSMRYEEALLKARLIEPLKKYLDIVDIGELTVENLRRENSSKTRTRGAAFGLPFTIEDNGVFNKPVLELGISPEAMMRRRNIGLMRNWLNPVQEYEGYEVIIVSSSTPGAAAHKQKVLDRAFDVINRRREEAGLAPILILSVPGISEGGHIIGHSYAWKKAEELAASRGIANFREYIKGKSTAVYHDCGEATRFIPLTQSLDGERAGQYLVDDMQISDGSYVPMTLLLATLALTAPIAKTNDGLMVDTFWTNEVFLGTVPHSRVKRGSRAMENFVVEMDMTKQPDPQDVYDLGIISCTEDGRMAEFVSNRTMARQTDDGYEIHEDKFGRLKERSPRLGFDLGPFSMSQEMLFGLLDYWEQKGIFEIIAARPLEDSEERRIDSDFLQPMIVVLNSIDRLRNYSLPDPASFYRDGRIDFGALHAAAVQVRDALPKDARDYLRKYLGRRMKSTMEVIELILLNSRGAFRNGADSIGVVNLGVGTQLFRYKRPVDVLNDKLEMLSDLSGAVLEVWVDGEAHTLELTEEKTRRAEEAREMRGIPDSEAASFLLVDGRRITLSLDQVKEGVTIDGVYIKNSIIRGDSVLLPGSRIVHSVLHNAKGKIVAENSYIESSSVPEMIATNSVIHKVVDDGRIEAHGDVIADVYRPFIDEYVSDELRLCRGQTRIKVPMGYNPNEIIRGETTREMITRTECGRYTLWQLREEDCDRARDDEIFDEIKAGVEHEVCRQSARGGSHRRSTRGSGDTSWRDNLDRIMNDTSLTTGTLAKPDIEGSVKDAERAIAFLTKFTETMEREAAQSVTRRALIAQSIRDKNYTVSLETALGQEEDYTLDMLTGCVRRLDLYRRIKKIERRNRIKLFGFEYELRKTVVSDLFLDIRDRLNSYTIEIKALASLGGRASTTYFRAESRCQIQDGRLIVAAIETRTFKHLRDGTEEKRRAKNKYRNWPAALLLLWEHYAHLLGLEEVVVLTSKYHINRWREGQYIVADWSDWALDEANADVPPEFEPAIDPKLARIVYDEHPSKCHYELAGEVPVAEVEGYPVDEWRSKHIDVSQPCIFDSIGEESAQGSTTRRSTRGQTAKERSNDFFEKGRLSGAVAEIFPDRVEEFETLQRRARRLLRYNKHNLGVPEWLLFECAAFQLLLTSYRPHIYRGDRIIMTEQLGGPSETRTLGRRKEEVGIGSLSTPGMVDLSILEEIGHAIDRLQLFHLKGRRFPYSRSLLCEAGQCLIRDALAPEATLSDEDFESIVGIESKKDSFYIANSHFGVDRIIPPIREKFEKWADEQPNMSLAHLNILMSQYLRLLAMQENWPEEVEITSIKDGYFSVNFYEEIPRLRRDGRYKAEFARKGIKAVGEYRRFVNDPRISAFIDSFSSPEDSRRYLLLDEAELKHMEDAFRRCIQAEETDADATLVMRFMTFYSDIDDFLSKFYLMAFIRSRVEGWETPEDFYESFLGEISRTRDEAESASFIRKSEALQMLDALEREAKMRRPFSVGAVGLRTGVQDGGPQEDARRRSARGTPTEAAEFLRDRFIPAYNRFLDEDMKIEGLIEARDVLISFWPDQAEQIRAHTDSVIDVLERRDSLSETEVFTAIGAHQGAMVRELFIPSGVFHDFNDHIGLIDQRPGPIDWEFRGTTFSVFRMQSWLTESPHIGGMFMPGEKMVIFNDPWLWKHWDDELCDFIDLETALRSVEVGQRPPVHEISRRAFEELNEEDFEAWRRDNARHEFLHAINYLLAMERFGELLEELRENTMRWNDSDRGKVAFAETLLRPGGFLYKLYNRPLTRSKQKLDRARTIEEVVTRFLTLAYAERPWHEADKIFGLYPDINVMYRNYIIVQILRNKFLPVPGQELTRVNQEQADHVIERLVALDADGFRQLAQEICAEELRIFEFASPEEIREALDRAVSVTCQDQGDSQEDDRRRSARGEAKRDASLVMDDLDEDMQFMMLDESEIFPYVESVIRSGLEFLSLLPNGREMRDLRPRTIPINVDIFPRLNAENEGVIRSLLEIIALKQRALNRKYQGGVYFEFITLDEEKNARHRDGIEAMYRGLKLVRRYRLDEKPDDLFGEARRGYAITDVDSALEANYAHPMVPVEEQIGTSLLYVFPGILDIAIALTVLQDEDEEVQGRYYTRLLNLFRKMGREDLSLDDVITLVKWDVSPDLLANFLKRIAIPPAERVKLNVLKEVYDRMINVLTKA